MKHKRQQAHAKATPMSMIPAGIVTELADMMQVWSLNESTCPAAIRQLPDNTLNLHDEDFYIWMKRISPKEDIKIFKQQFWHLFRVSWWFNTLTNANFSKDSSVHGFIHLCAPKKCPPFKHGIKQSKLTWWLGEKARLTSELAKQVIEVFSEQHMEYTRNGTTWNEAAKHPTDDTGQ